MMNVKVLGGGGAKCNALENNAIEALKELNVEYELEHVKDYDLIMGYGVMSLPALVVDDEIIVEGQVSSKNELIKKLKSYVS